MIKNTDEQLHEETHDSSKIPSTGASVPVERGCITLPRVVVNTDPEALGVLYCGIFMQAPSYRLDRSLTQFPDPLPFLEDGGRG